MGQDVVFNALILYKNNIQRVMYTRYSRNKRALILYKNNIQHDRCDIELNLYYPCVNPL